jgi:hypothetical protein
MRLSNLTADEYLRRPVALRELNRGLVHGVPETESL